MYICRNVYIYTYMYMYVYKCIYTHINVNMGICLFFFLLDIFICKENNGHAHFRMCDHTYP